MAEKLVLDTCALVWLATGSDQLSPKAIENLDAARVVYVSPMSAWEIGLWVVRNKLNLPMPARDWFNRAVNSHDLVVADLSADVLFRANDLPWHHRDPADRFIIATADLLGASIVTRDSRFALYDVPVIS